MNLEQALRSAFCDVFVLYLKSHGFHWNVMGPNFPQYHALFERIYEDLQESIDDWAEHMRAAGFYAPGSLATILENTNITETRNILEAEEMIRVLAEDNYVATDSIDTAIVAATEGNSDQGLINFLAERADKHEKHGWMLRATLGK